MFSLLKKIKNFISVEMKYHYIKSLPEKDYESFLIDEYKEKTGESLDIKHPKKFTEKMQYAKLYLNTPIKTRLSDKYLVREWVANKIGEEHLIPLLGVWDNFSDINFDSLPNRFVLKLNNGSGTNIIVKDKKKLNNFVARLKFDRWKRLNFAFKGDIQPHYKDIQPKIIAEAFVQDKKGNLPEIKFFCFDGIVYYCWYISDEDGHQFRNVYDTQWNLQPWQINDKYPNSKESISKPKNFDKMLELAAILSEGFTQVRVDLYNVDGKIYFGEMTFTSGGGYSLIHPEEYNYKLGDLWNLEKEDNVE